MHTYIIAILLLFLSGCRTLGFFEFNSIQTSFYAGSEVARTNGSMPAIVWFGPYKLRTFIGPRFSGPTERYEKTPLPNSEINAWWEVPYKNKPSRYFYARSFPNKGIQAKDRHFLSDWQYFAYISFGPMSLDQDALTEKLKSDTKYYSTAPSGLKYYSVGKETSFYYYVNENRVGPEYTPLPWIEVPGIEITQQQFEILHERCDGPWQKMRCFMDLSFPELTDEQKAYIKSHAHKDDEYNLSDKAKPPKIEKKVNPWL
jgi:hypothetical protein